MRTYLAAAMLAALSAPALCAGPEAARLDFMTPSLSEGLAAVKAAAPRWASVSMNVDASDPFYDVRDMGLRINLNGNKSGAAFYFNGSAGSQHLNINAYPYNSQDPRQGYTLNGTGTNLSINRSGSSYSINGWVNQKSIWLQASPRPGGGFSLWGQMGLSLNVSGMGRNLWVTGSVDLNQFDEPVLAALGTALCVLNSLPPQAKPASAKAVAASFDSGDLLDLLKDRDPQVRIEALKTARFQQGINTDVREKVFQMAGDLYEDPGVRREATRTLFWVTNLSETREKLLDLAKRDRDTAVRAMAFKALYQSALTFSDIRDAVREAARSERDHEVRKAAIWALFDCTGMSEVLDTLKDIAGSYREDADIRAEAVKSLFLGMNRSEVKDLVLGMAKDKRLDAELRVTAIYALYAGKYSWDVQDALKDMSRENDAAIRAAAVKALGNDDLFMRAYFHIGTHVNGHVYVSPIENE